MIFNNELKFFKEFVKHYEPQLRIDESNGYLYFCKSIDCPSCKLINKCQARILNPPPKIKKKKNIQKVKYMYPEYFL